MWMDKTYETEHCSGAEQKVSGRLRVKKSNKFVINGIISIINKKINKIGGNLL